MRTFKLTALLTIFFLAIQPLLAAPNPHQIPNDTIKFGKRTSLLDKVIEVDLGLLANPKLYYNKTASKWMFTNNGTTFKDVGNLDKDMLTNKGDLYVATGASNVVRLAVGTNDYVLTADSTQPEGVKWAVSGGFQVIYEEKFLSSSITGNTTNVASLGFSGLTIGKSYRVYMQAVIDVRGNTGSPAESRMHLEAIHNGTLIAMVRAWTSSGGSSTTITRHEGTYTSEAPFVATATTVTFNVTNAAGVPTLLGGSGKVTTWVRLEEWPANSSVPTTIF